MMYIELSEKELLRVRIALMEKGNNWLGKSVESLKRGDAETSESEYKTAEKYHELAEKFMIHHE
jgi:hypothetical protein